MNNFHTPVLLQEIIEHIDPSPGKKYIDATIGGGGHTEAILEKGGLVLGIDVDQDAHSYVQENFKFQISNFKLKVAKGNFRDIDKITRLNNFEKVAGIIFDLGVSSFQIDNPNRGFSFQKEGELDMRMDQDLQVKALDLINGLTKSELYELFTRLGEESFARPISDMIVKVRTVNPIKTTTQLRELLAKTRNAWTPKEKAMASKKVFQALRIAVNSELDNIKEALPKAIDLLENKGRLAIISFHSLEDRIVKENFILFEEKGLGKIVTKKPIEASEEEVSKNKRSRSAKLRVFIKL